MGKRRQTEIEPFIDGKRFFQNVLFPLTGKIRAYELAAFDIETITDSKTGQHKFLCGSIFSERYQKTFFNQKEMQDFMLSERFRNMRIFSTCLDFDFFALFGDNFYDFKFELCFRGSSIISAVKKLSSGHKITLLDTMNFWPVSVERLGEYVGIPKLPRPKAWLRKPIDEVERQELIRYNMRDSEISYHWAVGFQNKLNKINCNMKRTIASSSMYNFRRNFQVEPMFQPDRTIMLEQLNAYYGGRCECFSRGLFDSEKENSKMYVYDINSMYSWAMCNSFPMSSSIFQEKNPTQDSIMDFEGVVQCDIKTPKELYYPLLPYRNDDGKLLFPLGSWKGSWYTCLELRKAYELGYEIKPRKAWLYSNNYFPFVKLQKEYYRQRQEDKEMSQVYKLLGNSLYGKFGQRFEDELKYYHISELEDIPKDHEGIVHDYVKVREKREPSDFVNPIYSIYTTAYGRLRLYSFITSLKARYCDTDSCFCTKKIDDSNELGMMKLEKICKKALIVRPKVYFLEDDIKAYVKAKGMRLKTGQDFDDMLKNSAHPIFRIMKLKESIIQGKPILTQYEKMKKLDIEDTKRRWPGRFRKDSWQDSEPIVIQS
jgi:hypothetical protein